MTCRASSAQEEVTQGYRITGHRHSSYHAPGEYDEPAKSQRSANAFPTLGWRVSLPYDPMVLWPKISVKHGAVQVVL